MIYSRKILGLLILLSSCGQTTEKDKTVTLTDNKDSLLTTVIKQDTNKSKKDSIKKTDIKVSDSFIINKYQIINLADSINVPLDKNIWQITISYMNKNGFTPSDYYIERNEKPHTDHYYINLMRLNGYKHMFYCEQNDIIFDGHYGIDGDEIQIIYSTDLKNVLEIANCL